MLTTKTALRWCLWFLSDAGTGQAAAPLMAPEENEVEVVPGVEGNPIEFRGLAPKAEQEGVYMLLGSRPFPDQWLTVAVLCFLPGFYNLTVSDGSPSVLLETAPAGVIIWWLYWNLMVRWKLTQVSCVCFWLWLLIRWLMVEDSEEERPGIADSLGLELTCCATDWTFPKVLSKIC